MSSSTQAVFERLPPVLRSVVVSGYGAWLLSWRLGPSFDRYRREALVRDTWDADTLAAWQRSRLAHILERAATGVPYYRNYWDQVAGASRSRPWTRLENWPVLRKSSLRGDPRAFLTDGRRRLMLPVRTSGSTGTPLKVWRSRQTVQRWYALFEARVLNWHGLRGSDPWATFGGRLVAPAAQPDPPFWAWDAPQKLLVLSSYHLAPARVKAYLDAMRERQVAYILGYASSLYWLARFVVEQDLPTALPPLRAVISSAEQLYPHQREMMSRAFRCRVIDTYRMVEAVSAASECEHGRLHLWPEVGVVEILKDTSDAPAAPGEIGRLICSGLLNEDMPLIRYEVGDRGALSQDDEPCSCRRALSVLEEIEGRLDEVVVLRDGRRVGRLGHVFTGTIPIREAQIVQEDLDLIRVLVVPEKDYSSETARLIKERMHDRLGAAVSVHVESVHSIPRGPNGKFRGIVSHVT